MNNHCVLVLGFLLVASLASAQTVDPALRPPKGAQVALVVFEDLQCPDCRRAAPLVAEAGRTYKIPVVRHDFPLPMHNWSFDAAIIARYFDTQSKQLGNDFRDYIFQHQPEITPPTLRSFAEKFATDHKVDLPFVVDPQGNVYFTHSGRGVGKIDQQGKLTYIHESGGGHWMCLDAEGSFSQTQPKFFKRITLP